MTTFAFLLDMGRCIGCQGCVAACKTGNELPTSVQYIQISDETHGTFPDLKSYVTNHRCYHCADAACVNVCPTGALYKEDGMTRLDREKCSGCSYCVDACPFDVPNIYENRSSKCDACAEVVSAGGTPWCVKTCPSNALMYADRETILAEAKTRLAALQQRYPNAQIYGETEAGGLGVIMVLPDAPEMLEPARQPGRAAGCQRLAEGGPTAEHRPDRTERGRDRPRRRHRPPQSHERVGPDPQG